MVHRLLMAIALVFTAIAAFSLLRNVTEPTPPAGLHSTRPNILLITIDTLRADRVGRGVTPTLDRLASSGRRFTNARATVPLTLPSHVSIMTGLLPPAHGVRDNGLTFSAQVPTLARVLGGAGYQTGAFVGAYVLDRRFGLAEGFQAYDDRIARNPDADARLEADRRASAVVDAALAWLAPVSQPFFLWVHLYDPHAPYDPPAEFLKVGSGPYDGEVAYSDAQVGRLLEAVRGKGAAVSTVVAVMGDHGEGLGDHGEQTHGMLAYDSTLRVPLVIAGPGIDAAEIAAPVSLVDVAPSLLRRAGLANRLAPEASQTDLLSTVPADRDVYAESVYPRAVGWHPLSVLAGEQWKLVLSSEAELFDLVKDPAEASNLAAERPAIVQAMRARLTALATAAPAANAPAAAVPAEAAERLRALGYVSGASAAPASGAPGPNPARMIAAWTEFERALGEMTAGRSAQVVPALKTLARDHPSARLFHTTLARALQDSGDPAAAVAVYKAAASAWPSDATLFHDLAVAARAAGNTAEAMRAEQAALALDAGNPAAQNGLGLLHADAGRPREAAAAFERAVAGDPSNASYWTNLGNARREIGDVAAAERAYRSALDRDAGHPDAANGLGVILVQQGNPAAAVEWFERALSRTRDFHEARLNLGIAYQESGQRDRAVAVYRELLKSAPQRSRERQAASELLKGMGGEN